MRRFVIISFSLHAALLIGIVLWFRHQPPPLNAPDAQGAVELVMLEQQGSGRTTAPRAPAPQAATAPSAPAPSPTVPPDNAEADDDLPSPPPAPPAESAKPNEQPQAPEPAPAPPPAPHSAAALEINLGGTNSETNAIASGDHVIPASLDAKFHNKEPIYPLEAARRAEQGAVILLIHVSPNGLTQSVDVEESSGFASLDQAARDAVEGWHFLPPSKMAKRSRSTCRCVCYFISTEGKPMVRIDRVVTRGGDAGETSLGDGVRIRKDAPRIAAIGAVDEADAAIGVLRLATRKLPATDAMLARIQNDLFDVGADLSVPGADGNRLRLTDVPVERLEVEIQAMNATLPPLKSFILPGGTDGAAYAHMARTVTRRAERAVVRLATDAPVTPALLRYLNRLSDHLFVLARVLNGNGTNDVLWVPGGNLE